MKRKLLVIALFFCLAKTIFANDIILKKFQTLLANEDEWIPVEYLDIIRLKDRETIKKYVPNIEERSGSVDYLDEWRDWYTEEQFMFETVYYRKYEDKYKFLHFSSFEYDVKDINLMNNIYNLILRQDSSSIYNSKLKVKNCIAPYENLRIAPLYEVDKSYYKDSSQNHYYKYDEIIIDAKFIFDGDFLTVYANNDKFMQVYFRCSEETFKQLKSLIYSNTIDLSKVTWPRHADGTCDYEDSDKFSSAKTVSTSTNVASNVNDNC